MSNITIFSGNFTGSQSVISEVLKRTGFNLVTDTTLISQAVMLSGMSEAAFERVFAGKPSIFNKFTHEKERAMAYLKLAMAGFLTGYNQLMTGYLGHFIPREVTHILNVCLIGDIKFRVSTAVSEQGLSETEALKIINKLDIKRAQWVENHYKTGNPWDRNLYDIRIPLDKVMPQDAAALIVEYLKKDVIKPTVSSKQAVADFTLAAKVEVALVREGHNVEVKVKSNNVFITINKNILMLSRLEEELKSIIANKVPGVKSVETVVGRGFHQTDVYRRYDFQIPSRVLLVDDEREFVQTLSERLILRDMGTAVAHDGESALAIITEDEPDVIVLDLKMPGIDGIEVLRRVKEIRPNIEVIIVTGHGSEADCTTCMDLGAYAYLQKPVNIELLSKKLQEANNKGIRNVHIESFNTNVLGSKNNK